MHILIIPSWYSEDLNGPNGCFFRDQAIALSRSGHQIGLLVPPILHSLLKWKLFLKLPFGYRFSIEDSIPVLRHFSVLWIPQCKKFIRWMSRLYSVRMFDRYVALHGFPDIIHAHCVFHAGVIACGIHEKYKIPFVITEHSSAYQRGMLTEKELSIASEIAGDAADCCAVSLPFARKLNKVIGGNSHWKYLPNILAHEFENCSFSAPCLNNSIFSFCNVSSLTPNKNIDLLINAFASAFKNNDTVALNIGGDGEMRSDLEQLVKELGIGKQTNFLGLLSRAQVRDLMKNSHVYVSSSDVETFGVTLIEMLSMGRPVIATCSGGPETIVESGDGFLVPINDVEALANAMIRLRDEYNSFDFKKIREHCLSRFSSASVVSQLNKVYSSIIERS